MKKIDGEKTIDGTSITTSEEFLNDLINRIDKINEYLKKKPENNLKLAYLIGSITGLTKRLNRVCYDDLILFNQEIRNNEDLIENVCVSLNIMLNVIKEEGNNVDLYSLLFTHLMSLKETLTFHYISKLKKNIKD